MIELIESFKSHDVEFLVVGAHALAHHGRPRFTEDLDFFVRRTDENVETMRRALQEFGLVLAQDAIRVLKDDVRGFVALGRKPHRVDLLNFLDGVEFDRAWARRSAGHLGNIEVSFLSVEDYIATKRASDRPKDRLDLEILKDALGFLPGDEP